jgi:hypothetical protein
VLIIREAQMHALAADRVRLWLAEHLEAHFPDQWGRLDGGQRQSLLTEGIRRAKSHGFTKDQDVCLFVTIMLLLGRDFETDPNFTWASGILNDPGWQSPAEKLDSLYAETTRYLTESDSD